MHNGVIGRLTNQVGRSVVTMVIIKYIVRSHWYEFDSFSGYGIDRYIIQKNIYTSLIIPSDSICVVCDQIVLLVITHGRATASYSTATRQIYC